MKLVNHKALGVLQPLLWVQSAYHVHIFKVAEINDEVSFEIIAFMARLNIFTSMDR